MQMFKITILSVGFSVAGSLGLYCLPIATQGYILGALSILFALVDSFYGALISRTNSLTGLTGLSVDEYHNICDNVCNFQRRLLFAWLIGKLLQLLLAGIAVAEIQLNEPFPFPKWALELGGYVIFCASMYMFAYMVNTYIVREAEIFSIYKKARVKANEARLESTRRPSV